MWAQEARRVRRAAYAHCVRGDGDGWADSDTGSYWGRHGAAGLLLRAPRPDGTPVVLLQHRAWWSHQGGTWAVPGGARDSHETVEQAAIREAEEEAGLPADRIAVRGRLVTATPGGTQWTYTTVVADAAEPLAMTPQRESTELRWVAEDEVEALPLHPGFAAGWHRLRTELAVIPLADGDDRRRGLPRTVQLESGGFVWCAAGDAGQPGADPRLSQLLQALS